MSRTDNNNSISDNMQLGMDNLVELDLQKKFSENMLKPFMKDLLLLHTIITLPKNKILNEKDKYKIKMLKRLIKGYNMCNKHKNIELRNTIYEIKDEELENEENSNESSGDINDLSDNLSSDKFQSYLNNGNVNSEGDTDDTIYNKWTNRYI